MTDKQEMFVKEYLIDLNATQAAIRAGYSSKTAAEQGYLLLNKPAIQDAVSKAMADRSRRTGVNQDRVVMELAKLAFAKVTDICDTDGYIKAGASDDDLACIESIKVKKFDSDSGSGEEREIKLASKVKALELLGKHVGMWNDKLNVQVSLPVVISGEDELQD